MNQRLRDGTLIVMDNGQDKFLQKLYGSMKHLQTLGNK